MSNIRTDFQTLLELKDILGISDDDTVNWIAGVLTDERLVDWLMRQHPETGTDNEDAYEWADGNPNGFGRARILATIEDYGALWPLNHQPATLGRLARHVLFGRAAAVCFGHGGMSGWVPTVYGPVVRFRYQNGSTVYTTDKNETLALGQDWDWEWDEISEGFVGTPSLTLAQAVAYKLRHANVRPS